MPILVFVRDKMYKRYSPDEDLSGYDFIVVGSGIGGLSTAIFLSKAGKKVLVLESHYVPGGFTQTFNRNSGLVWDVGVHYVGNLDKETSFLRRIFDYLSDQKLNWEFIGNVYDVVHFGKDKFSFVAGKENLKAKLVAEFPDDRKAIEKYFKEINKAACYAGLFFLQKSFPLVLQYTVGAIFKMLFKKYSSRTTSEVIDGITKNSKLKGILCAQCGNYGLPPSKSSFAAHAIVTNHFMEGGYYPIGGSREIYKTLLDNFFSHGGELRIKAKVDEIVVKKNRVQGVTVDGKFISCINIVSNAGASNTFQNLIPSTKSTNPLAKVKSSTGHLCLYVGLDQTDVELKLPRHNIWYYKNYDFNNISERVNIDSDELPFAYLSFPSSKDPDWKTLHPATSTIQVIIPADYEWFKKFENSNWMKRGEEYEGVKNKFKEKLLAQLYLLLPQTKGHVVHAEISTPLSTKHFTNYSNGEIYGLEHTPERFNLKSLQPKSTIGGLYLAGQDIVTVGVGGALASSLLCATQILKFGMTKQFRAIAKQS